LDGEDRPRFLETNAATEPFVATFVEVEAVGGEGVAEGADRATLVIIATEKLLGLVAVGSMGTQTEHTAGLEKIVNDAQDTGIAEGGVTDDIFDVQRGVEGRELEELGSEGDFLAGVGRREVIEQDDMEAAGGIGEEERETGISIAGQALFGISLFLI
jgi:hypothetical protein